MVDALQEQFLQRVALEKNISLREASVAIDECLRNSSSILGIPYSEVHSTVYDPEYLEACINVSCDKLTLEQCKNSCFCVEIPSEDPTKNECVPRYIRDAEIINRDPDKYAQGLSVDALKKLMRIAAYLYYNYEGGGLTDNAYDALEYNLNKKLKLRGKRYEKIGAPPIEKLKVKLPIPLASLNKVKPNMPQLLSFITNSENVEVNPKDHTRTGKHSIVWSLKLDGSTGFITYKNGKLDRIYTRGDGTYGGDVTYLKDYIKLPQTVGWDYFVRGEFIITKKIWLEKYKNSYSNARSFVTAKLNSGFITPDIIDIDFVAYDILYVSGKKQTPTPELVFTQLKNDNFNVPDYGLLLNPTIFQLIELYKEKRENSKYYIDGLVLAWNIRGYGFDPNLQHTLVNPTSKVAFKMDIEAQRRETRVTDIEWNISRYGRYIPVAIYDAVFIDGVRLHRASAHNAAHIREWNMGNGTKITIARSGDVIPAIKDVKVDLSVRPIYPSSPPTEGAYSWHWEGRDIVLDKIDGNREVEISRIYHFYSTLGIPKLGEKTVEKLYNSGFKTIASIAQAKPRDLEKVKGISNMGAVNMWQNIRDKMRTVPLDRYVEASSSFNIDIGRNLARTLFRYIPNILELNSSQIKSMFAQRNVPGFGQKRIEAIAKNMPKFREYLFSINDADVKIAIDNHKQRLKPGNQNKKISDKRFVLTGFMGHTDYELEDSIYNNHGDIVSDVSSNVECVIASNISVITDKMTKARSMNIPVYTIEEFASKYDLNLKRFEDKSDD